MKNRKMRSKLIASLLCLMMIVSMIPISAQAAVVAPFVDIEGRLLTADERASFGISDTDVYGLFFHAGAGTNASETPLGITAMTTSITYDKTKVLPYDYSSSVDPVNVDCFIIVGQFKTSGKEDTRGYSYIPGFTTATNGDYVTFEYGVYADPEAVTVTDDQDMFVMLFKAVGGSTDSFDKTTIKVETNADTLSQVKTVNPAKIVTTAQTTATPPTLTYSITYPNSTVDALTAVKVAVPRNTNYPHADVPKDGESDVEVQPSCSYEGLDGTYAGTTVPVTVWSLVNSDLYGIKIDPSTGKLTISTEAIKNSFGPDDFSAGSYAYFRFGIKASASVGGITKDGTKTVVLGRDASYLASVELSETSVQVEGNATGSADKTITATAYDQYGVAITSGVTWSFDGTVDGNTATIVAETNGTGTVTVKKDAPVTDAVTVKATTGTGDTEKTATEDFAITHNASVPTTITVGGGVSEMTVPGDSETGGKTSTAFTTTIKDQYGSTITSPWRWSIKTAGESGTEVPGISIGMDGAITIANNSDTVKTAISSTTPVNFTVTATSTENSAAFGTATVAIARATPVATAVKIYKGETEVTTDSLVIPLTGGDNEATYTAKLFDQYDTEITGSPTFTWNATGTVPTYTTVSPSNANNKVTVSQQSNPVEGTNTGSFTLTASFGVDTVLRGSVAITVTKLNADWSGITTKTSPVYGDTNGDIIEGEGATSIDYNLDGGTTYGETLTGSFAVTEKDTAQGAGDDKTIIVTFTADSTGNGDYNGVVLTKEFTVDIAKADPTVDDLGFAIPTDNTYNGDEQRIGNVEPKAGVEGLGVITVVYGEADAEAAPAPDTSVAPQNAGEYSVWANIDNIGDNYNAASIKLGTYTIGKATISSIDTTISDESCHAYLAYISYGWESLDDINNGDPSTLSPSAKELLSLPATVDVKYAGGDKTELAMTITWADTTDTYDPKGAAYTFVGTLTPGDNFNETTITKTVTYTVTPVTGTITTTLSDKTVAESVASAATDYGAFGLPTNIGITYSVPSTFQSLIATYSVPLNTLKAMKAGSETTVTLTGPLPVFATITSPTTMPSAKITITDKFPVDVSFTTPITDITYGETLGDPMAEATQRDSQGIGTGTFQYEYKLTSEGDNTYSQTKPTKAGDYTVRATYVSTTHAGSNTDEFKILPLEVGVSFTNDTGLTYTGNPQTPTISLVNVKTTDDVDFTVSYEGESAAPGLEDYGPIATAPTNAGSYTVTVTGLTGDDADNYELNTIAPSQEFTIAKATAPTGITGSVQFYHSVSIESGFSVVSLTGTPDGWLNAEFGDISMFSDTSRIITSLGVSSSDEKVLTYVTSGNGIKATVDVPVDVNSTNYETATATITFKAIDILIPWPEESNPDNPIVIEATPKYGDTNDEILSGFIAEQNAKTDVDVPGVFSVKEGTSYASVGATTVTLVFTPKDTSIPPIEQAYVITAVAARPLTIRPNDYKITEGGKLPTFELLFDGIVSGEDLTVDPEAEFELYDKNGDLVDQSKSLSAGTYTIKWVDYDTATISDGSKGFADNYDITKIEDGTLIVLAEDDDESYRVTASAGNGGYIRPSGTSYFDRGDRATYKITASTGYEISAVYVDGRNVGAVDSYTFSNIRDDHEIEAVFAKLLSFDSLDTMSQLIIQPDVIFTDVFSSDWFYDYVMDMAREGVINGYPDGSFKPAGDVTWGEALKLVMKSTGYPSYTANEGEHWATGYMLRAINFGLIDGAVDLDKPITRGELADLAAKALKLGNPTVANPFEDEAPASATSLYEAGIITGSLDSGKLLYRADSTITRAEMATVVWRMFNN